jgi:hypothetical protein
MLCSGSHFLQAVEVPRQPNSWRARASIETKDCPMSNHFREMALKAKAAYDEKVATKRRKKEADADAKAKGILAQVEVLRDEVLPLLNEAKVALEETGVGVKIAEEYLDEASSNHPPRILFQCLGLKRPSDRSQIQTSGLAFTVEGDQVWAAAAESATASRYSVRLGSSRVGEGRTIVSKAVQHAVNAYYAELSRHQGW